MKERYKMTPQKLNTNVETLREQAYQFSQLKALNMDFAANRGGTYQAKGMLFEIQVDNGLITKATQTNYRGDKISTIFVYNENGDIKQQIYDYGDDGKYEYVYDFDCKYNENNELISHEESMWSQFKNGCKRFFGVKEKSLSF